MPTYLGYGAVADRLGIAATTFRSYCYKRLAPPPDVIIEGNPPTPGWLAETIDRWNAARPGSPVPPRRAVAATR